MLTVDTSQVGKIERLWGIMIVLIKIAFSVLHRDMYCNAMTNEESFVGHFSGKMYNFASTFASVGGMLPQK